MDDEQRQAAKEAVRLGEDLGPLSIEELEERITFLEAEIVRIQAMIKEKSLSKSSAEGFFKN